MTKNEVEQQRYFAIFKTALNAIIPMKNDELPASFQQVNPSAEISNKISLAIRYANLAMDRFKSEEE